MNHIEYKSELQVFFEKFESQFVKKKLKTYPLQHRKNVDEALENIYLNASATLCLCRSRYFAIFFKNREQNSLKIIL